MTTTPPTSGGTTVDIGAIITQVLTFLGAGSTASYTPKKPKLKGDIAK
ncbi:hypothetical protein [Nocardia aurantiaca]|uniref:Uncharacterized protein n=1 Tax=Nocardia aurantiaca TaxID=2675850 RepID=A0A6I3L3U1_9NOCA|nr:hypothetical protein [Nocardia aurantiaca]MTE17002.1 hypothetical protein [Nocardia aurantiaca]